jgi:GTP-binding protein
MSGIPTVAVVGRPNVGKSTMVNRFLGKQVAIVEEKPGVTRDRKQVDVEWRGRTFHVIDTGGWLSSGSSLEDKVSAQSERATKEADLILFIVDGVVGITSEDEQAAQWVRKLKRPVMLIVNKVDSGNRDNDIWEFASLGLGDPVALSALHGRNSGDVLDAIVDMLPESEGEVVLPRANVRDEPRVAIVGRPNVGKSTLFNRMVGEDRAVVHDMPGTTRDVIDTVIDTEDGPIRFVDTAGMRRKAKIDEGTEYYSFVRALQAIDTVDAVVLVIDAEDGVTNQDQRLAERIDISGKPVVIALNKWELLDAERRAQLTADVEDALGFIGYAPVLKISALSGKGVHKLLPAVWQTVDAYTRRLPTAEVTKVIRDAQQAHQAAGAKIFYAMQGATEPPTFTIFANRKLQPHYLRYIERKLREHFDLGPSPIKLRVRRKGD